MLQIPHCPPPFSPPSQTYLQPMPSPDLNSLRMLLAMNPSWLMINDNNSETNTCFDNRVLYYISRRAENHMYDKEHTTYKWDLITICMPRNSKTGVFSYFTSQIRGGRKVSACH